jgi:hypothetical protein
MIFPKSLLVVIACLTLGGVAFARTWTTVTGQHFDAEFVRQEGANGIFNVKGKDYPYPLNQLSVADRLFIGRAVNQLYKPASAGGTRLVPGAERQKWVAGQPVSVFPLSCRPVRIG